MRLLKKCADEKVAMEIGNFRVDLNVHKKWLLFCDNSVEFIIFSWDLSPNPVAVQKHSQAKTNNSLRVMQMINVFTLRADNTEHYVCVMQAETRRKMVKFLFCKLLPTNEIDIRKVHSPGSHDRAAGQKSQRPAYGTIQVESQLMHCSYTLHLLNDKKGTSQ